MTKIVPENLRSHFFKLAIINILSNITVPIAGLVDTAFLGHLKDISNLVGVALASIILTFIYGTCAFLRLGTTGPTAQSEGSGDQGEVLLILLRSSLIALIFAFLLLLLQSPLQDLGFALLNTTDTVKMAGRDYFSARILGAPAVLLNFSLIGWLLGRGKSIEVLILFSINCVSNI
ncbi:MAG: MATE family efflux transporter, partial [Prochloron sp. SP5CPC1]|nr:MATE family efflux transporter [Candidatus Paraprochloron terpiosi SP5CPC1]